MNKKTIIAAFPTFLRPYRWQALRDYRRLPVAFLLALIWVAGQAQPQKTTIVKGFSPALEDSTVLNDCRT